MFKRQRGAGAGAVAREIVAGGAAAGGGGRGGACRRGGLGGSWGQRGGGASGSRWRRVGGAGCGDRGKRSGKVQHRARGLAAWERGTFLRSVDDCWANAGGRSSRAAQRAGCSPRARALASIQKMIRSPVRAAPTCREGLIAGGLSHFVARRRKHKGRKRIAPPHHSGCHRRELAMEPVACRVPPLAEYCAPGIGPLRHCWIR